MDDNDNLNEATMLEILKRFLGAIFKTPARETPINTISLEEVKNQAKMVCENYTPETFDCAILTVPPKNPVITPLGKIYEEAELKSYLEKTPICPGTLTPLSFQQVRTHSFLTKIYQKLNAAQVAVPKEIDTCKNKEEVEVVVAAFNAEVTKRADKLQKFQEDYVQMQQRKIALKLDITNPDHLSFWQKQCSFKIFGGGVKVALANEPNRKFSIPTGVHRMMLAAQCDAKNMNNFIESLHKAKTHRNIFSWFSRSRISQKLYTAKNLRTFSLSNTPK